MNDFATFYLEGGLANHFLTIGFGFATTNLVLHARTHDPAIRQRWLALVDRVLIACVAFGLLSALMGLTDLCRALAEVPFESSLHAAARGLSIAIIPLEWALIGAVPLAVVVGVQRARLAT